MLNGDFLESFPMRIFALMFLSLSTFSSFASAETLKEKADRICHAYIDHPEDFKEIKMGACDENIKSDDFGNRPEQCFEHKDLEKGVMKTYGSVMSGGSCRGISIGEIRDSKLYFQELVNTNVNGYGFGSSDKALDYKEQLLVTSGFDLRMQQGENEYILCVFARKSLSWKAVQPDNALCRAFDKHEYKAERTEISSEEVEKYPEYPVSSPYAVFTADLNADEKKEIIIGYNFASGAGCGCDAKVLKVSENNQLVGGYRHHEKQNAEINSDINNLDEKLENLTGRCGRRNSDASVISIDGRDYVLLDRDITSKENKEYYLSYDLPVRELYAFENGDFVKVCTQEADAKHVIEHEIVPPEKYDFLSYHPL